MPTSEIYFHSCSGLGMIKAKVHFETYPPSKTEEGPVGVVIEGLSSGSYIYYDPMASGTWVEENWGRRYERCRFQGLPLPSAATNNPLMPGGPHIPALTVEQRVVLRESTNPISQNERNVRFRVCRHTGRPFESAVVCDGPTSGSIAVWWNHQWWEARPAIEVIKEETSGSITVLEFRRASRFVCGEDTDRSDCYQSGG